MAGSTSSVRKRRSTDSVPSSSSLIMRLKPATSAAMIAASRRSKGRSPKTIVETYYTIFRSCVMAGPSPPPALPPPPAALSPGGIGGFDRLGRRQTHHLRQIGIGGGLVRDRHGLDEVLLELGLDRGFDLFDPPDHALDLVPRLGV